jgi:hypothetical protein
LESALRRTDAGSVAQEMSIDRLPFAARDARLVRVGKIGRSSTAAASGEPAKQTSSL